MLNAGNTSVCELGNWKANHQWTSQVESSRGGQFPTIRIRCRIRLGFKSPHYLRGQFWSALAEYFGVIFCGTTT